MRTVLIFLYSAITFAASYDVACVSKKSDIQYNGELFENGIYITAGCYEVSSLIGAKQKALNECQKWANYYGVAKFEAKVYEKSRDSFTSCHNDIKKISSNLEKQKFNKVHEVSEIYKESGTIFFYTSLYIDNHQNPKAIYDKSSGRELSQWLKIGKEFFCGKIEKDIAFKYNAADSELVVINVSSKKKAVYKKVGISEFELLKSDINIKSPFLFWEISQNHMSYIDFYKLVNGKKIVERHEEILYFEGNLLCR